MASPLTIDTTNAAAIRLDAAKPTRCMSSSIDIELSPTESDGHVDEATPPPLHHSTETKPSLLTSARPYDMIMSSDDGNASHTTIQPTAGGLLSQRILQAVQHHQLQRALQERRAKCHLRRVFAVVVGVLPILLFAWSLLAAEEENEAAKANCHSLQCLLGQVEEDTYFGFVAVCGGFGALLYSDEFWNYSLARWVGGCVAALGSILTIWTVSQAISVEDHAAILLALMCIFLGVLGSLPGLLLYHVIKIAIDECFAAEADDEFDDEYTALTVNLQAQASEV